MDMSDEPRDITTSLDVVALPEVTTRDSNNVQRFWRRSKGYWLITHGHGKLERLLGRKVAR
jgi:hypothetical protein